MNESVKVSTNTADQATVVAVSRGASHTFSKSTTPHITLIAGHGVEGDAHCGMTVKHRSRVGNGDPLVESSVLRPPSSRGLGRRPLTAETGVRIPVAV